MRRLAVLTTLALILAAAESSAAQDKQNKQDDKGGLGGVLDTLGNVLGTGTQKRHGTVVANEPDRFVAQSVQPKH